MLIAHGTHPSDLIHLIKLMVNAKCTVTQLVDVIGPRIREAPAHSSVVSFASEHVVCHVAVKRFAETIAIPPSA